MATITDTSPLIEGLSEAALIAAHGRVIAANAAARGLLGTSIEGAKVDDVIAHPAAIEAIERPTSAVDGVELAGLGEAERRWTMSIAPLEDGALFVRLSDRSEAHAAERMRVDFVANASHELRTPLATLLGYTETLREQADELDEATRRRFTTIVHDEARRMQRLVEDLVSLSRIEAERFNPPTRAARACRLVEEVRDNVRHMAAERGGEIRLEAAPGPSRRRRRPRRAAAADRQSDQQRAALRPARNAGRGRRSRARAGWSSSPSPTRARASPPSISRG